MTTKRSRNSRSVTRGFGDHSERGSRTVAAVNPVVQHAAIGYGEAVCPACGTMIRLRADGNLAAHRIGRGRQSWPCPRDEAAPR